MRQSPQEPNPDQSAFEFEEVEFSDRVQEVDASSFFPPEHIPVYTVFLRRSNVLAVQERPQIHSPQDAATVFSEFLKEADREHLVTLLLDSKNQVIGLNVVSVGILDSALVHPREIFKPAILANAASIILCHNHPSGDPTPSIEDKRVTERVFEAGKIIGIDVIDHVVVGEKGKWVSLKQLGAF
jgi:DNA repair protein RadC